MLIVGEGRQIELTRREHLGERLGHPQRSVSQVRRGRIAAEGDKQVTHSPLGSRQVDPLTAMHDPQMPTPVRSPARYGDLMLELGNAHA